MRTILVAAALVLAIVPTTFANAQGVPTCFGREATIVGTNGDDDLFKAHSGPDVWVTLQGDDSMDPEDWSGRDYMCGGSGNDAFGAWLSDDRALGAGGRDRMQMSDGADKAWGGGGNDSLANADFTNNPPFRTMADGDIDVLDGGDGTDTCYAEVIDIVRNCEVVVQVP